MQREAHASGMLGEIRAEQHIAALGYEILSRNAVFPGAEIDLIARDGACIVFIEVKLRTGRRGGAGREGRRDGRPCAEVCQARASSRKARRALSTACSRRSVLSTRASAQES